MLGFRVVLTLEQGLDALLQWYRSRPASAETLLHEERTFNWHVDRSTREEMSA